MGATARHARLIECATIFACWGLCSCSPHAIRRRPHMPLIQDEDIAQLLRETDTIAMIGISDNPTRPSYGVMAFLQERSEERRVGKECVRTCRSRWSPYH